MTPYMGMAGNPLVIIDPTGMDNYYINSDGRITRKETDDDTDSFYNQNNNAETGFDLIGAFTRTVLDDGTVLVDLTGLNNNAAISFASNNRAANGTHTYLNSSTAAAFIGAAISYHNQTGNAVQVTQFSNSSGGHSSRGTGNGGYIDMRYASTDGNEDYPVWTNGITNNYDQAGSQTLADNLINYGFNGPANSPSLLTENGSGTGAALTGTHFVNGSNASPPFHHKHHIHAQRWNGSVGIHIPRSLLVPIIR